MNNTIRIHQFEKNSRVNGPGNRCVLWVQGCTLGCPGCFNPQTHPSTAGSVITAGDLLAQIIEIADQVEGITISGGEPLQQINPLLALLDGIRSRTNLSIVLFTGFQWAEIQKFPRSADLLSRIDVIIAGRYISEMRTASGLQGSANKTFHFLTSRYSQADFESLPESEVIVDEQGNISISGIDPLKWS